MTCYAKPINRPLALEGWFEKPTNRLFGHLRVNVVGTVVRWYLHTCMSIQSVPSKAWVVSLIHAMFMIYIRLFCSVFLLFALFFWGFFFEKELLRLTLLIQVTSTIVKVLVKLYTSTFSPKPNCNKHFYFSSSTSLPTVHSPPNPTVINIFTFRHRHHYLQYILPQT